MILQAANFINTPNGYLNFIGFFVCMAAGIKQTFEIPLTDFDRKILRIHHYQGRNYLIEETPDDVVERYEHLEGILVCRNTGFNHNQLFEPKENREAVWNALEYNGNFQKDVTEGNLSYLSGALELCMLNEPRCELKGKVDLVGRYGFATTSMLAKTFGVENGTVNVHMNRLVGLVSYFLGKVPYYSGNGKTAKKLIRKRFYYIPFARRDYVFGFLEEAGKIASKEEFLKNVEMQQEKIANSF